jgi:hypothetical protein
VHHFGHYVRGNCQALRHARFAEACIEGFFSNFARSVLRRIKAGAQGARHGWFEDVNR